MKHTFKSLFCIYFSEKIMIIAHVWACMRILVLKLNAEPFFIFYVIIFFHMYSTCLIYKLSLVWNLFLAFLVKDDYERL